MKLALPAILLPLHLHAALPEGLFIQFTSRSLQYAALDHVSYRHDSSIAEFQRQGIAGYCESEFICNNPFLQLRGMATVGEDLFAIEVVTQSGQCFLTKANDEFAFARVSQNTNLGNPEVEALVWTGEQLIAAGRGPTAGTSVLLELSVTSGAATPLNIPALNTSLTGLAWDPGARILYGASKRVGAGPAALYQINTATGALSLVGPLAFEMGDLTWIAPLGLIGSFDMLYLIHPTTAKAIPLVSCEGWSVDGDNGVFALAANGTFDLQPPRPIQDVTVLPVHPSISSAGGAISFSWVSSRRSFYDARYSPDLNFWNWDRLYSVSLSADKAGKEVQFTHSPPPHLSEGFYQLYDFEETGSTDPIRILMAMVVAGGCLARSCLSNQPGKSAERDLPSFPSPPSH